jgi:hypothetical protein
VQSVVHLPTTDEPVRFTMEGENRKELTKTPILAGLVGAAAVVLGVMTILKKLPGSKEPGGLSAEQRHLLKTVIARGEKRKWNLSYDEFFIFKLLPGLKAIVR